MQCPSCGFENMPGRERCTRCGAGLVATGAAGPGAFTPPRAGRFRRLRSLGYRLNRLLDGLPRGMPERLARVFRGNDVLPGEALAAMLLSAVPGLGHFLSGRRRAALAAAGVWLLAVALAVNHYYGLAGALILAFVVAWHASVVFDAGRAFDAARGLVDRVRMMLIILVACGVPYFLAEQVRRHYVEFLPSPLAIRSLGVERGDILSFRPGPHDWSRGDLCVTEAPGAYMGGFGPYEFHARGFMLSVVVGLAGDTVEISPEGLRVNGSPVPRDDLPSRGLPLPAARMSLTVREGRLFAVTPVALPGGGEAQNLVAAVWTGVYSLPVSRVVGKATGIYLPFSRRRTFRAGG